MSNGSEATQIGGSSGSGTKTGGKPAKPRAPRTLFLFKDKNEKVIGWTTNTNVALKTIEEGDGVTMDRVTELK